MTCKAIHGQENKAAERTDVLAQLSVSLLGFWKLLGVLAEDLELLLLSEGP